MDAVAEKATSSIGTARKLPAPKPKVEREDPQQSLLGMVDTKKAKEYWVGKGWNDAGNVKARDSAVMIGARVPEAKSMLFQPSLWAGSPPVMCLLCPKGIGADTLAKAAAAADSQGIAFAWTDNENQAKFDISLEVK